MDFGPEKFFIGLVDFFSILLPGAVLTYLLKGDVGLCFPDDRYSKLAGTEGWAVFLFTSYLVGHFIFLVGSWLLDDRVYDPIRKATDARQVKCLAAGENLSPKLARWLAACFFRNSVDDAVHQAERIKERYLDSLNASSAINTFQWSKARLALEHSEALATVQHFEADSKFFRSFVIVLCVLIPWGSLTKRPQVAIASVVALVPALWRYVDQRVKATNQAYWYMITLEGGGSTGAASKPTQELETGLSHAGGVVVRRAGKNIEYLLVQAKKNPQEWVLPKGHIEPDEEMRQTAVREVREETGGWARIRDDLSDISFTLDGKEVKVRFYLMEAEEEGRPMEKNRKHLWLPLDKALSQASHKQSQELLDLASSKLAIKPDRGD